MSLIAAKILKETPKAIFLQVKGNPLYNDDLNTWLPKSQINRIGYIPNESDFFVYEIATWLIREKNMASYQIKHITSTWIADPLSV